MIQSITKAVSLLLTRVESIGDEDAKLAFLLHRAFESFLYVEPFAENGGVQFTLERQEIHVSLRLWDQVTDLLWQNFVCQTLFTLAAGGVLAAMINMWYTLRLNIFHNSCARAFISVESKGLAIHSPTR